MPKAYIGTSKNKALSYELNNLTRHAGIVGTTGSGKTVMCKVLIEEALAKGIPVIAIDPKGDIGTLGVTNKSADFRPFVTQTQARKLATQYTSSWSDNKLIQDLQKTKTTIYTPKSDAGQQVSVMPDLAAPTRFNKRAQDDPSFIANFVEPISESLCQLASIKGALRDKAQVLITALLIDAWQQQKDVTLASLIDAVLQPPFETIGSLPLDDFVKEADRKKIASAINVLLTSPAKQAWSKGQPLDIASMFKKNTLSVIDMRFVHALEEKQYVAEQVMQEIYRFLLKQGGTEKLKYILYIDELAGFLPPPPANPPSKRLLELLVRQGRAFGFGVVVATQNPGDIDYKLFGNIGTRFIGKLRTDNDIEKVATAMDIAPSALKTDIAPLSTGQFIYNNAVTNKTATIQARWLYSLHSGPLTQQHMRWINDPTSRPAVIGKLAVKVLSKKAVKKSLSNKPKHVSTKRIVESVASRKKVTLPKAPSLKKLITAVKKQSDTTQMKIAVSSSKSFTPHLKIVVESSPYKSVTFPLQGPYYFDLTSKAIPVGNYLAGIQWRQLASNDVTVVTPTRSIVRAFEYAVRDAQQKLRTPLFESTLINAVHEDRDVVEKKNHAYMVDLAKTKSRQLDGKHATYCQDKKHRIKKNNARIKEMKSKLTGQKAKRMVKRLFSSTKLQKHTYEMKHLQKRIDDFNKENKRLQTMMDQHRQKIAVQKEKLLDHAFKKAHSCVKHKVFRPTQRELKVHATILLAPTRNGML